MVNVPHPAIGSRASRKHLPPLSLLAIAGPLIDAAHEVGLIDGELDYLPLDEIARRCVRAAPEAVLLGHSGSTSAHPIVADLTRRLRAAMPRVWIVYGGIFPTYHWREILDAEPQIDLIVRGEGEETAPRLIAALQSGSPLAAIDGIAFRCGGRAVTPPPAPMLRDLNPYRVAWELLDFPRYSYWGGKRAVVVQWSRGCSHLCNYCGQRGFWTRWRHRDPLAFAAEIADLTAATVSSSSTSPTRTRPPRSGCGARFWRR